MKEKLKGYRGEIKILTIDGGGVRGIYPAMILHKIEKELSIDIREYFDLIVGTSTGAIVAAAVAIGYPLDRLIDQFENSSPGIFKKTNHNILCRFLEQLLGEGLCASIYKTSSLRKFLEKEMGGTLLKDIDKPLIINAVNISNWGVQVFKSNYQEKIRGKKGYARDGCIPLWQAVLASCCAPTYFDPTMVKGALLCDGGLWANNPALVGYIEALSNFESQHADIKLLSLGTGKSREGYKQKDFSKKWGFLTGWKNKKLIDFVMHIQKDFPHNSLELMLKDRYMRVDYTVEKISLDDIKVIPALKRRAEEKFKGKKEDFKKFFSK